MFASYKPQMPDLESLKRFCEAARFKYHNPDTRKSLKLDYKYIKEFYEQLAKEDFFIFQAGNRDEIIRKLNIRSYLYMIELEQKRITERSYTECRDGIYRSTCKLLTQINSELEYPVIVYLVEQKVEKL